MCITLVLKVLAFSCLAVAAIHEPRQASTVYDHVVVGSGPGGGPLAARLAIAGKKVLLIDAGGDQGNSLAYQVPAFNLLATEYVPMKWDYYVRHYSDLAMQKQDSKMTYKLPSGGLYVGLNPPAGATPLGILYPRTGALGGCAAHNALISVYPHAQDWAAIQTITGDSTWNPTNMRKYFKRLEDCDYLTLGVTGHGFQGWLKTNVAPLSIVIKDVKLLATIASAATAMGKSLAGLILSTVTGLSNLLLVDINADFAGRDTAEGLYQVPGAINQGLRSSPREFILATANAIDAKGARLYHLDIQLNTLVTKIRFDRSGITPRAIGVDYLTGQSLYRADPRASSSAGGVFGSVNASSEVIISAGAFNTPQLLKLSGIGASAELKSFGIPVVVDLPGVGTNMQDRYETSVIGDSSTSFSSTADCTFNRTANDPCLDTWKSGTNMESKGIYAINGIAVGVVKKSSTAEDVPDLFIGGAPANFKGYYPGYAAAGLSDARHWSWVVLKAHARNIAGTVKLASTDPRDVPIINFKSFDDPVGAAKDIQAIVEGMQLSRKMFSEVFPIQGSYKEVWPGPEVTDDKLADFVRKEAWGHHASCTCPIGADNDPMAVLDSKFRVRGTTGLRVVDASVFPKIPGFYIAVPIYMISEKAADVILGL